MHTLDGLIQAIVDDPQEEGRWLVLADWLDEHDDPRRAELLRLHRLLIDTCCEPEQQPERVQQQARLVELLGQGVRPCVPQRRVVLGDGVEMTFSFIPPGTFVMGSSVNEAERRDDETQHRVTLTKGYWLGVHSVTQAQWQAVMSNNPSYFKGDTLPVELVSWDDCMWFCKYLGEKSGQRFRLPTEAAWEYACRAGTTTPFFFGATISTDQANYDGRWRKGVYRKKTTPVGSFPANAWGLFDMHGNVSQWCLDWFQRNYPTKHQVDPGGRKNGTSRVKRGGSWVQTPQFCRSASRSSGPGRGPDRDVHGGCRIVLCLD